MPCRKAAVDPVRKPGEEIALTDKSYPTWGFTCLRDGRILVGSTPPKRKRGYYLMTPNPGNEPRFERIRCELDKGGVLARVSLSPANSSSRAAVTRSKCPRA